MRVSANRFAEQADEALADEKLQSALASASQRMCEQRERAFAQFPPGEALRDRAQWIKRQTLAELDRHLERLSSRVEARGGVVHWAADARQACEIVLEIVRRRGGRRVVKGKSMTSEEIGLNDALTAAGIEAVETDLGEYIIQLADETPSHIIVPAIHKTVEDVAALFERKHGETRGADHEALTREARQRLRAKFLSADVGVTGVNFAVAETGSVAIVENEGNIRLSSSLPGCHIALMGMEKVIPDLSALSVFLRILARSATGQKMSSYVSLVTGPRRDDEEDGPEEFHLVILDNGRSRLLADPVLGEALGCIRCGACLNVCPVYRHAGGHAYGWVYPGPIGSVIDPSLLGHEQARPLPFASSLCGACRDVCPVRIDLPRLLRGQRDNVVAQRAAPLAALAARAYREMMSRPSLYRLAFRTVYWLSRPLVPLGLISWLPGLRGWTRYRDLPLPARESFRARWLRRRG